MGWMRRRHGQPWATTPFTEAGFVRVSANRSLIPGAVTPFEALALLERMREVSEHRFLVDTVELVVNAHVGREMLATHRSVTDMHLLAVARHHGARLVTFDRGIATLAQGRDVELLPFD